MEEGIVVGGGCTLLRLASKVDAIKETLANDEEKVSVYELHSMSDTLGLNTVFCDQCNLRLELTLLRKH